MFVIKYSASNEIYYTLSYILTMFLNYLTFQSNDVSKKKSDEALAPPWASKGSATRHSISAQKRTTHSPWVSFGPILTNNTREWVFPSFKNGPYMTDKIFLFWFKPGIDIILPRGFRPPNFTVPSVLTSKFCHHSYFIFIEFQTKFVNKIPLWIISIVG